MNRSFKENFNFITNILLIFLLVFGSIVFADSNGVWHKAEDVQGGTFGNDEQNVSPSLGFRFLNKVIFSSEVYLNFSSCNKLSTDSSGKMICNNTLDSIGLKNVQCPSGKAVAGFDSSGAIICNGFQMAAPINCVGSFNTCSASCNGGTQTYSITTNAENGGAQCPYTNGYVQSCNTGACAAPVNCLGSFSTCTATCGRGSQTYSITTPAANGGATCSYNAGYKQECNSQLCSLSWTRNSDSLGTANDVAVDVSGNVYVTGYYQTSTNEYYNTIKYDSNGIKLWNKSYAPGTTSGGNGNRANSIAVDPSGNVYVTGNSYQGGKDIIYTIKYDTNGNKIWHAIYNTGSSSMGKDIAVDSSGNVYITGRAYSGTYMSAIIIKYNSAGVQQFATLYSNSWYVEGMGISLDSSGNSYITGTIVVNVNYGSGFIAKYNSAGVQQWSRIVEYNYLVKSAVDSTGNILVVGSVWNTPRNDILMKYDTNGNQVYFSGYGTYIISGYLHQSTSYDSLGSAITIDSADNIYIAGNLITSGGGWVGGAMAKFSNTGSPIWSRSDTGALIINEITKDSNNKLYISGQVNNPSNYLVSKYDNYPVLPN